MSFALRLLQVAEKVIHQPLLFDKVPQKLSLPAPRAKRVFSNNNPFEVCGNDKGNPTKHHTERLFRLSLFTFLTKPVRNLNLNF